MATRRSLRPRSSLTEPARSSPATAIMSRPRRTAAPTTAAAAATSSPTTPTVTVSRPNSHSPDDSTKKSIRLTVKMPPTKLREATSGRQAAAGVNSRDAFEPAERLLGSRRGSRKRYYADESESEEDEDEEEDDIIPSEENDEEDDAEEAEVEEEEDEEEDEDAGGEEDVDAEGDVEMEDALVPVPPPLIFKATKGSSRPSVTVTLADGGKVKSVEAQEMAMGEDDDEELSELDSEDEGDEEAAGAGEQDGEGEGEGEEEAAEEDEEDEGAESSNENDNETPATGSRASTPDVSKMTKRQRSRLDQVMGGDFLQLPMGVSRLPCLPRFPNKPYLCRTSIPARMIFYPPLRPS
jgi:Ino eighty subunit 2